MYAALSGVAERVHVIAINKESEPVTASRFTLVCDRAVASIEVWAFDSELPVIQELPPPDRAEDNAFEYTLPPYSVCHFVIDLE